MKATFTASPKPLLVEPVEVQYFDFPQNMPNFRDVWLRKRKEPNVHHLLRDMPFPNILPVLPGQVAVATFESPFTVAGIQSWAKRSHVDLETFECLVVFGECFPEAQQEKRIFEIHTSFNQPPLLRKFVAVLCCEAGVPKLSIAEDRQLHKLAELAVLVRYPR